MFFLQRLLGYCYKSASFVIKVPYNVTKVPCCRYKSARSDGSLSLPPPLPLSLPLSLHLSLSLSLCKVRVAEKFKTLICISLLSKCYFCLIPRSVEYSSQFSAIPHLTPFLFSTSKLGLTYIHTYIHTSLLVFLNRTFQY